MDSPLYRYYDGRTCTDVTCGINSFVTKCRRRRCDCCTPIVAKQTFDVDVETRKTIIILMKESEMVWASDPGPAGAGAALHALGIPCQVRVFMIFDFTLLLFCACQC